MEHLKAYYEQSDVIPIYGSFLSYEHFDEAVLHMRKDKANLHLLLDDVKILLDDYNSEARQANSDITERIRAKICEAGLDENNANQIRYKRD